MEAINSLGIDWKLLVAQAINFLLLLIILKKFLYGPIVKILGDRKEKIAKGLKEADKAKQELAQAEQKAKEIITRAISEANEITLSAQKEAKEQAQKILEDGNRRAQKVIGDAKEQAGLEQEKAVSKAKNELAELIIKATEKIVGQSPSANDVSQAIKQIK